MKVSVVRNILDANERIAEENRKVFKEKKVFVVNMMSSPGAGKTTLLEELGKKVSDAIRIGVIEGDIQSTLDAERVAKVGLAAVQIETDGACHLDANMIRESMACLDLGQLDLIIVENVGNLVCPAEFAIGEDRKIMVLSVTEGDDKPSKYPLMFQKSDLLLINKIDLLPHVRCSIDKIRDTALAVNPGLTIIPISPYTGEGMDAWWQWLRDEMRKG